MHAITHGRIDIPLGIRMNTIGETNLTIRKNLAVFQPFAVWRDVESVNVGRPGGVVFARERVHARVGHVDVFVIGREFDAVRSNKAIRHNLHPPSLGLKAINLRSNLRLRSKMLPKSISRISKPQIARDRMLHDIINRTKIFAQKRIQQDAGGIVHRVDQGQLGGMRAIALVAEDEGLVGGAGERGSGRVIDGAAVGVGEIGVAARGDFVGGGVDDGDVDGVGEISGPVACGVDFVGGCWMKKNPLPRRKKKKEERRGG